MTNPTLVGEVIHLSPLTKEDISDRYVEWLNDPVVCRDNSRGGTFCCFDSTDYLGKLAVIPPGVNPTAVN